MSATFHALTIMRRESGVCFQLGRTPRPLPVMRINPDVKSIFDFRYEDFSLENYDPLPHIRATVSV